MKDYEKVLFIYCMKGINDTLKSLHEPDINNLYIGCSNTRKEHKVLKLLMLLLGEEKKMCTKRPVEPEMGLNDLLMDKVMEFWDSLPDRLKAELNNIVEDYMEEK